MSANATRNGVDDIRKKTVAEAPIGSVRVGTVPNGLRSILVVSLWESPMDSTRQPLPAALARRGALAVGRFRAAGRKAYWRVAGSRLDGPVLVFQMGKVGSQSVYFSLQRAALGVP